MLWAARVLARAFGMVWGLLSRLRRQPAAADPAEALRSKLAAARARDSEPASVSTEPVSEPAPQAEPEPAPQAEPEPDQTQTEPASTDLASLRRDVHAKARALSEEMRGTSESD